MSIYGTWLSLGEDEHEDGCAAWVEVEPGDEERSGQPCSCGTPRAPIVYEGSHVLPADTDPRGGSIDVAAIPDFITRDGRDDARGEGLKDWLRLSVRARPSRERHHGKPYVRGGDATVVLTRPLVSELRDTLTAWLERDER
jgi:hypothetical protein